MESLFHQESRQSGDGTELSHQEYYTHVDIHATKTKWLAKSTSTDEGIRMCVMIATSNFHQELMEECISTINGNGSSLTPKDIGDIAIEFQIEEHKLVEEINLLKKSKTEASCHDERIKNLEETPFTLLHRSGDWLSLTASGNSGDPDVLAAIPLDQNIGHQSPIRTNDDFVEALNNCQYVAIKNIRSEQYLSCRRSDITDLLNVRNDRKVRFIAEYSETLGETEKFKLEQNSRTGGFRIKSCSNDYLLNRRKNGGFAFKGNKSKEEAEWVILPHLQESFVISEERILFAGVIKADEEIAISHHVSSSTAWRTEESWNVLVNQLLEKMEIDSSTTFIETDTGHRWFATKPKDAEELYIVITSNEFSLHYGSLALMNLENWYDRAKQNTTPMEGETTASEVKLPELETVLAGVEAEYHHSYIYELKDEVDQLSEKMLTILAEMQKNVEKTEDLARKTDEMVEQAKLFKKQTSQLPNGRKAKIVATTAALGAIGATAGFLVGGPAGALFLETQAIEIIVGLFGGMSFGFVAGAVCTSKFWKRSFVSFGRCLNSRELFRKKREREEKKAKYESMKKQKQEEL